MLITSAPWSDWFIYLLYNSLQYYMNNNFLKLNYHQSLATNSVYTTASMLVLTFTARDIRNYYLLPNVWVERLKTEQVEIKFSLEDGTEIVSSNSKLVISKELYDNMDEVFIIENRVVYDEKRTFLKRVFISLKCEN